MRPITVTVGPLVAASANNIATSQSPAGTSGTAAVTFTNGSASITATNTLIAGQHVKFVSPGGTLPAGLTAGNRYWVSATGLSGSAFQVTATFGGASIVMQSAGTGSPVVQFGSFMALNGTLVNATSGNAVLDTPRRVLITTADTTTTFTITGLSATGTALSESLVVSGGASYSTLDYAQVMDIGVSQAPTAAVTVGTNGIASSAWVRLDEWANTQVTIQFNVSGTVSYTLQSTMDDPNSNFGTAVLPSAVTWVNTNDTNAVNATGAVQTNFLFAPVFCRILLNSGSGSVTGTFAQSNVANR
jgi:hypothetical protein